MLYTVHVFAASPCKIAQNRVAAVRVTVEECHLILEGYDLHRNIPVILTLIKVLLGSKRKARICWGYLHVVDFSQ